MVFVFVPFYDVLKDELLFAIDDAVADGVKDALGNLTIIEWAKRQGRRHA